MFAVHHKNECVPTKRTLHEFDAKLQVLGAAQCSPQLGRFVGHCCMHGQPKRTVSVRRLGGVIDIGDQRRDTHHQCAKPQSAATVRPILEVARCGRHRVGRRLREGTGQRSGAQPNAHLSALQQSLPTSMVSDETHSQTARDGFANAQQLSTQALQIHVR